eukprot:12370642-Alexandrium_andersonii.AAC.1
MSGKETYCHMAMMTMTIMMAMAIMVTMVKMIVVAAAMAVTMASPKQAQTRHPELLRGSFCAMFRAERESDNEGLPGARSA